MNVQEAYTPLNQLIDQLQLTSRLMVELAADSWVNRYSPREISVNA